jgi:3-deoxy-D-manno-octulosonate 8-phosphate phosphatase (KDO 8-P phosphatase)
MISDKLLSSVQLVAFDFDGVFTDNTVYVSQDGIESVRCWRSDGLGLSRLHSIGVKTFIISTEANPVVTVRSNKLNMSCTQGIEDKAAAILQTCIDLDIDPKHTMFVGNDINDIPAFKSIGLPVAVEDAYPEVYPHVIFRTKKPGGFGAVREVCDLIFESRNGKSEDVK